jgi:hypothetical protein
MEGQDNNHCRNQENMEEPIDISKPVEISRALTPRQLQAFSVIVSGGTKHAAAAKVGVERRTIYDWEQTEPWKEAMDAFVRDARVLLILRMGDLLDDATKALEQALRAPHPSERKLLAARTVINSMLKLQEGK